MGQRRMPGLHKRKDIWHIDKTILGQRICESTGTSDLEEAQTYLIRRLEAIRQASIYGVRPKRSFREAAIRFLKDHQHKRSLRHDAGQLATLDPFIGDLSLEAIHMGSLQAFIEARRKKNLSMRTINHGLRIVRRILNLAATEWMDQQGLSWLLHAPKIKFLPEFDQRKPYPLSWEEQKRLFQLLPPHLQAMALFAVNTGCRDQEICGLRWEWEVQGLSSFLVFIVPGSRVKNGDDRLIICNDTARAVVEAQRGKNPKYVFIYKRTHLHHMLNSGWRTARERAGLNVRVHDLKHTFGRRLRAAGVSFEDRQDLLGHRSGRITTHYSAAELQNLYEAANKVCEEQTSGMVLNLLRPSLRSKTLLIDNKPQNMPLKQRVPLEAPCLKGELTENA